MALYLTAGSPVEAAQTPAPADIPVLLKELEATDERAVVAAAMKLTSLGPPVVPHLVDALRQRNGCQLQWTASGILYRLEPKHELVNTSLAGIAAGRCTGRSQRDLVLRRQAAFALVGRPDGIPIIAALLADNDVFSRRTAAFAFDDLTERLEGRAPAVEPRDEIVTAVTGVMGALGTALADRDEVVRCMSFEALDQASRSKHDVLRTAAIGALAGRRVECRR